MWIFTRYGFFSIACAARHDGSPDPQTVMVRARRADHLSRLQQRFPALADARVIATPDRDYGYRIVVPKAAWADAVRDLAMEQTWSNFKNEAARHQGRDGDAYVHALHQVWGVMAGLQARESRDVQRGPDGAIANAEELQAADLANQRVLCPACHRKVFVCWPEGWDGHAGYACTIEGATPKERKENYKRHFRALFR